MHIQQNFTSVGNPQANGQMEVTNRIILQYLKTRLDGAKGSWVEELPGVLWAYRTTPKSSTGDTPFNLVYGSEAVIPAEIGMGTHRLISYNPEENQDGRYLDLETIEEKRDRAYIKMAERRNSIIRTYNKRVKQRSLQVGDLVLKKVEVSKHVGKLDSNWEGPYQVSKIAGQGAYRLKDLSGVELPRPWNIKKLKKFFA